MMPAGAGAIGKKKTVGGGLEGAAVSAVTMGAGLRQRWARVTSTGNCVLPGSDWDRRAQQYPKRVEKLEGGR